MAAPDPAAAAVTIETAHGRHEERRCWVMALPPDCSRKHDCPGLAAVARIDAVRRIGGKQTTQIRYDALSRVLDPAEALRVVRAHWSIENNQHWRLDVALADNLAILRRLSLNPIRADPTKISMRLKRKKAAWQDGYLLKLLSQMR